MAGVGPRVTVGCMNTLNRSFWATFEHNLASLRPLVERLIHRRDWTVDNPSSVSHGGARSAPDDASEARDQLAQATQATAEDCTTLGAYLASRSAEVPVTPDPSPDQGRQDSRAQDRLADTVDNLIEVRSDIEGAQPRSRGESAALEHAVGSASEVLRLIRRDLHRQD